MNAFSKQTLPGDIRGGVVSFLVAVPLCLGIALASGVPLFSGIIAGIVGGLVVGIFSRSALSISGPEAGLIVVVLAAVNSLPSFEAVLLATCLAGVLQIGFGLLKAGTVSHFFPSAVIKGMLAAIGLILIFKQLPHLVGYDADSAEGFSLFQPDGFDIVGQLRSALQQFNGAACLISLLSLGILLLWEVPPLKRFSFFRTVPAALLVVTLGILVNSYLLPADVALHGDHLVRLPVPESVGAFFSLFTLPDFGEWTNPQVYASALSIALVASLEALLAVEATDELDPLKRKTPPNRELVAQGIGNIASGLVGGMPLTSVIVRSSVSINAGGRTRVAALVHGTMLLVSVLALPTVLNQIPWAALASILLVTGYKLARPVVFRQQFEAGLNKFLPFVTTVAAILLTDLLTGILIGMVVGVFFILRETYRKAHHTQVYRVDGEERIRIRMGEYVSFLNKASVASMLKDIPDEAVVEIDSSRSTYIDSDVMHLLSHFEANARQRNIRIIRVTAEYKVLLKEPVSPEKIRS